jgi:hypothetical protein
MCYVTFFVACLEDVGVVVFEEGVVAVLEEVEVSVEILYEGALGYSK